MKGVGLRYGGRRWRALSAACLMGLSTLGWAVGPAHPPWSWRADARVAPPGLAHVTAEAHRRTAWSSASAGLRWTTGGGTHLGLSVALHSEVWSTGVGCALSGTGGVEARFGIGHQEGAFEVVVPVVQPVVLPFRPTWRLMRPVEFGRGARGAAFLSWSPGSAPAVWLHGWREAWSIGAGTSGVFVAREVRRNIRRGWPSGALEVIENERNRRYLTKVEEGQLRGEIAHAYFIFGIDEKAIRQARHGIGAARDDAFMAYWSGGLAAWRSGKIEFAGAFFRALADNEQTFGSLRSAAAFWAHRVEMREGRAGEAVRYLEIASRELHSFYGVMARQILGQDFELQFDLPRYDDGFIDWLSERPGGPRLFALLQIGRVNDAERELRYLWPDMPETMQESALRFAIDHGMAGLAYRAGELLRRDKGRVWLGAIYPIPQYDVEFSVDQALVWAISRQESGFNPRAKSRARAAGLMQIMPATASFVTKNRTYRGRGRHLLLNPQRNLEIGQAYINKLLNEPLIDGSIVRLLAAYNGGPGNLRKWLARVDHQDDPFLLIESIPARETRHYIKSVISNLALYRMQLGESAPELRELAAGGPGRFVSLNLPAVVSSEDGP